MTPFIAILEKTEMNYLHVISISDALVLLMTQNCFHPSMTCPEHPI